MLPSIMSLPLGIPFPSLLIILILWPFTAPNISVSLAYELAATTTVITPGTIQLHPFASVSLNLKDLFDNQAASSSDGNSSSTLADFDGKGSSFDSQFLPKGSPWVYDGIEFDIPEVWGNGLDNVITNGQVLNLEEPTYVHELHFLYSGDVSGGEFVRDFLLNFEDDSQLTVQLYAKNWWRWPNLNNGQIQTPYHFERKGDVIIKNFNTTYIYQWSTSVSSESKLKSITLAPNNPARRLHIFALSYTPSVPLHSLSDSSEVEVVDSGSNESQAILSVRRVRFTTKWELVNNSKSERAQVVEITLSNLLPTFTISKTTSLNSLHTINIRGEGIQTVKEGKVHRLVPADQVRVEVLVTGTAITSNSTAEVEIKDSGGNVVGVSKGWEVTPLIEKWTPDAEVLARHEVPTWWKKAKYGIFIHWGVYSFPAWAPDGTYAEWYNWDLHRQSSPTWNHHLQTYGKDVVYDDFITNFTASKFNASSWLDLFDDAGAKYFVFVTKHHDGFALFDTGKSTNRNSVSLGPKRDFLNELMETAKREKPHIHRGTYYSLPEWFNPDYARYGFGSWPGGLAHNPFDNFSETEPYTGRLEIRDYVDDLQLPQMQDLVNKYDTEIMWCDIGGPNRTLELAAEFYNHAQSQGRQVTINNRCGAVPDFDTPEYATFGAIQTQAWESNEGMDPFSYGLNSATKPEEYKNATEIIQTLVDITSKNGNFLLDIGPNAEGEIISPMETNLRDAGKWLKYAGSCIYDTTYWFAGSQDQGDFPPARFTTTATSFCIIAFSKPSGGKIVINKRLPVLHNDKVVLMHPKQEINLKWQIDQQGRTTIFVSDDELEGVKEAYVFRFDYKEA